MEVLGVRWLLAPTAGAVTLVAIGAGIALGTVSGLVPGLHVNNLALLLAAVAPSLPGPPHLVGAAILAAGVVHSFLDVVPTLALGVPDPSMAAVALPGHRLVLGGRGREALRLSALGSGAAVAWAMVFALPVTELMTTVAPVLSAHIALVLGVVEGGLLLGERTARSRRGALLSLVASGVLGVIVLDVLTVSGPLPTGDALAPLFAGLFGAPILIDALGGEGIPPQGDGTIGMDRREAGTATLAGTAAGAAVGYLPGVSSAVASIFALSAVPGGGDRGYLIATSGANTANAVFALFALLALGAPRTGVLVAFERASLPYALPHLLLAIVSGAAVGAVLVVTVGERYLRLVGRIDTAAVTVAILLLLAVLSGLFAGAMGLVIFVVATAIGRIPITYGARRVHLMGVLMVPIALG